MIGAWLALAFGQALLGEVPSASEGPSVAAEPAQASEVWVVATAYPGPRLERVVKQAERMGATAEPVGLGIRCLTFDGTPDPAWLRRVERRLGVAPERRSNCSVARYPEGEGWWVAVLSPDPELDERIEASLGPLGMSVLAQPLDGRPASLCVSSMHLTRAKLEEGLKRGGIEVLGVHAVGSCTSRVHTLPLRP